MLTTEEQRRRLMEKGWVFDDVERNANEPSITVEYWHYHRDGKTATYEVYDGGTHWAGGDLTVLAELAAILGLVPGDGENKKEGSANV